MLGVSPDTEVRANNAVVVGYCNKIAISAGLPAHPGHAAGQCRVQAPLRLTDVAPDHRHRQTQAEPAWIGRKRAVDADDTDDDDPPPASRPVKKEKKNGYAPGVARRRH